MRKRLSSALVALERRSADRDDAFVEHLLGLAQPSRERDFVPRHGLDDAALVELFGWSTDDFSARTAGSPLHRLGHARWLRNIAVALGNGPPTETALAALASRLEHPEELVREHARWAWERLQESRRKNVSR